MKTAILEEARTVSQRLRYSSGLHLAVDMVSWADIKDLTMKKEGA